jgi:hypothetical protein
MEFEPVGSGGASGTRTLERRTKRSLQLQVQLSVLLRPVAQVEVDQALVGDVDLFGGSLLFLD